jgi:hypothetical protein
LTRGFGRTIVSGLWVGGAILVGVLGLICLFSLVYGIWWAVGLYSAPAAPYFGAVGKVSPKAGEGRSRSEELREASTSDLQRRTAEQGFGNLFSGLPVQSKQGEKWSADERLSAAQDRRDELRFAYEDEP